MTPRPCFAALCAGALATLAQPNFAGAGKVKKMEIRSIMGGFLY